MENRETLLQMMIQCMHSSHALSVQIEGFKLAQCLAVIFITCLSVRIAVYAYDFGQLLF